MNRNTAELMTNRGIAELMTKGRKGSKSRGQTYKAPILILIAIVFLSSCELLSSLTEFDLPYEKSFSIPLILASDSTLNVETPTIPTGIASAMEKYNTGLDLIDEISLSSMTLTLTDPIDGNFGFLESIEVYISATGQDEIQLASKLGVATDVGAVLELETSDADLQNYIKQDDFKLRFNIDTDENVLTAQEIKMDMVVHVDAKILGL